jgi:hypothetical protein
MRKELLIALVAVFCLGWIASILTGAINSEASIVQPSMLNGTADAEKPSPSDWIKESAIHVYPDKIVIDVNDPRWASFTDTNSMDPFLDKGANAIEIIPESADQIGIGDIVAYESTKFSGTVIHRVIDKGVDSEGTYFIIKGDNNANADPGKVRFSQIKRVLIAVIY